MLHEGGTPRARVRARVVIPPHEVAGREPELPAGTEKKPIDVVFDLDVPEQAEKLEFHRAAFGAIYAEVVPLGGGKVVLRMYPGGARRSS